MVALDKDEIKTGIAANPVGFYGPLVGGLKGDGGSRWTARCPLHPDSDPSLTIYADGTWYCFGCNDGGDGLDFIGKRLHLDFPEALRESAGRLGLAGNARKPGAKQGAIRYEVRDADGRLLGTHCRLDLPGGKKVWWKPRGVKPAELPLWNTLPALATDPALPVVVAEGEKAADALMASGQPAVGTYGAAVLPCEASLRPLLGRSVVLWPDNDQAGRDHMQRIAERLTQMGCTPHRVNWPDAPEKGDAADFVAQHSPEELRDLLAAAVPCGTACGPPRKRDSSRIWTATELQNATFPEPRWIIPGLLPEGMTLFGGRAKLGKSWAALQIAHAVGTGGTVFGAPVETRRVLYLALEDGPRRVRSRMVAQRWGAVDAVCFAYEAEPTELERLVDESGCQLLIVDTLSRLFDLDQDDVQPVTKALGQLQRMAQDQHLSVLVTDHHSKRGGGDPISDLLGSTGKGAVADTIWGLYRTRGQRDATLKIVGRDVEDSELRLSWDDHACCWQRAQVEFCGKHDAAVFEALTAGPAGVSEIARRIGVNKGVLVEPLARLVNTGRLRIDPTTKKYSGGG